MSRRTPLYSQHIELGARMADFAGWELPIQYTNIGEENAACRNSAALFDICHMGEIRVESEDILRTLNGVMSCDFNGAVGGSARYGFLLNDNGTIVDDVIAFLLDRRRAIVVTNASNTQKDFEHISGACSGAADVADLSDETAKMDLQGPVSNSVLRSVIPGATKGLKRFHLHEVDWSGTPVIVSRTGYTGERGYELLLHVDRAEELWAELLRKGKPEGLAPAGLAARDTLRLEAGLPLYGHELSESVTPAEAGLMRFVSFEKAEDFPGKTALQQAMPPARKLVGLEMMKRSIPREGYEVRDRERPVGKVTSGTLSPALDRGIAMAYVESGSSDVGSELDVVIRNRPTPCVVVGLPFHTKKKTGEATKQPHRLVS